MPAPRTDNVTRAIAMLKENPAMTRYQAAKMSGITPGALYNSRECKSLFAQRLAQPTKKDVE